MATKQQLTLKNYSSFLIDETSLTISWANRIKHSLSYQRYCYDLILGNKVNDEDYKNLYDFMVSLWDKKSVESEADKTPSETLKQFTNKDNWWKLISKDLQNKIWMYYSLMYEDPSFKDLSIEFLKGYIGILTIDRDKNIDNERYINLVKMINVAFENWIIEWKDITINFNLIVRNTYKTLPRNFLKIC